MKSTINNKANETEYPCLMIAADGDVVSFYEKGKGLMVHKNIKSGIRLGEHYDAYVMSGFEPFKGSITLEND